MAVTIRVFRAEYYQRCSDWLTVLGRLADLSWLTVPHLSSGYHRYSPISDLWSWGVRGDVCVCVCVWGGGGGIRLMCCRLRTVDSLASL